MPRKSPGETSANLYRIGGQPPRPPRGLGPRGCQLWKQIVGARPRDFFIGYQHSLAIYVRVEVARERLLVDLAAARTGSERYSRLLRNLSVLSQICGSMARQLRLTLRSKNAANAGILNERGLGPKPQPLLGGHAVLG